MIQPTFKDCRLVREDGKCTCTPHPRFCALRDHVAFDAEIAASARRLHTRTILETVPTRPTKRSEPS